MLPKLEQVLRDSGLEVDRVRAADGFARILVTDGEAVTELDLASDFRLLPPERTPFGLTLAGEELAVDKVLALFDRAEPRDFVDLAAVVDRWGLDQLCQLASAKDLGFDRNVLRLELTTRIVTLCFDANEPLRLARFWGGSVALGQPGRVRGGDWPCPDGRNALRPAVPFRSGAEGRKESAPPRSGQRIARTAVGDGRSAHHVGAAPVDIEQSSDDDHVMLADSEGNELCVVLRGDFLATTGLIGAIVLSRRTRSSAGSGVRPPTGRSCTTRTATLRSGREYSAIQRLRTLTGECTAFLGARRGLEAPAGESRRLRGPRPQDGGSEGSCVSQGPLEEP